MSVHLAARLRSGRDEAALPRPGVESRDTRAAHFVAWAGAGAAGWMLLRALEPGFISPPPCLLREVFHIGCATCGLTRALVLLARGDLAASLVLHPLALPLAVEVVLAWLLWGVGIWRGRPLISGRLLARAALLTAVAAMVTWVVRLATGTVPA